MAAVANKCPRLWDNKGTLKAIRQYRIKFLISRSCEHFMMTVIKQASLQYLARMRSNEANCSLEAHSKHVMQTGYFKKHVIHTNASLSTVNGRVKAFFRSIMVHDLVRHGKNTARNTYRKFQNSLSLSIQGNPVGQGCHPETIHN